MSSEPGNEVAQLLSKWSGLPAFRYGSVGVDSRRTGGEASRTRAQVAVFVVTVAVAGTPHKKPISPTGVDENKHVSVVLSFVPVRQ